MQPSLLKDQFSKSQSIHYKKKKKNTFEADGKIQDKEENTCMLCLEIFRKRQCFLYIHCGHRFC